MTNSKTTKRALFSSVVALLLCFTMLLGTTFAWFTDTVTNGVNQIVSGNLDIELWHTPSYKTTWGHGHDETNATEVDANTLLFLNNEDQPIRWEPGAGAAETFRIKNAGSLALKYMFTIATANATETPEGKDLTDILSVQIIEMQLLPTGAPAQVPGGVYHQDFLGNGYVMEGELLPGETVDYFVAIDWIPSDRDNEFNVEGGLSIDLGITLLATQFTYEKDATGDQYDVNAEYPEVALPPITNAADLQEALNNGGEFVLGANIALPDVLTVPAGSNVTVDLAGYDIIANNSADKAALAVAGEVTLINTGADAAVLTTSGATPNNAAAIEVMENGVLNIEDGDIVINGSKNCSAIQVAMNGTVNVNGGRLILNSESGNAYGIMVSHFGKVNMTAGEIIVDSTANNAYGILGLGQDVTVNLVSGKITVANAYPGHYGVAVMEGNMELNIEDGFNFDIAAGAHEYGSLTSAPITVTDNRN